jgi:Protein of unknown function (DUF3592)
VQSNSRVTISVFAVASFLFGVASIALAVPFFWKQSEVVRNWPATLASVRQSEVVEITQGGQKLWATRFELSFDAGGKIVVATVNGYRQAAMRERVETAASRFPNGSTTLIRYNPQNPSDIRLDTDNPRRYYQLPLALAITGAIFIVIALVLFYLARK